MRATCSAECVARHCAGCLAMHVRRARAESARDCEAVLSAGGRYSASPGGCLGPLSSGVASGLCWAFCLLAPLGGGPVACLAAACVDWVCLQEMRWSLHIAIPHDARRCRYVAWHRWKVGSSGVVGSRIRRCMRRAAFRWASALPSSGGVVVLPIALVCLEPFCSHTHPISRLHAERPIRRQAGQSSWRRRNQEGGAERRGWSGEFVCAGSCCCVRNALGDTCGQGPLGL